MGVVVKYRRRAPEHEPLTDSRVVSPPPPHSIQLHQSAPTPQPRTHHAMEQDSLVNSAPDSLRAGEEISFESQSFDKVFNEHNFEPEVSNNSFEDAGTESSFLEILKPGARKMLLLEAGSMDKLELLLTSIIVILSILSVLVIILAIM